ncbi:unnamed protein product [Gongylonema pulchrum]|uniref:LITAF domain-containing protein n=1 Tax=Gongylonema pulchrum TaxID=637853 RepID=A0A183D9X8_9BILA|nr:unnamed protein product [Gongylonema pulchrum]
MPDPPTGLPFNGKPRKSDLDALLKKCPLPRLGGPLPERGHGLEEYQKMLRNAVVRVVIPTERYYLIPIFIILSIFQQFGERSLVCPFCHKRVFTSGRKQAMDNKMLLLESGTHK